MKSILCFVASAANLHDTTVTAKALRHDEDGECNSDDDCYGGRCDVTGKSKSGVCVCPPLWAPPNCQTLRLSPTRISAPGLLLPNTSTWGGTAVQDKDGYYHMIAARMEAHCGLHTWHNNILGSHVANSDIVHATALSPDGPYTVQETILSTFAHGPQTAYLPDGRVVIAHLGCGNRTLPEFDKCINGTTPSFKSTFKTLENNKRPPGLSNCDWPAWAGVLLQDGPIAFSRWKQLASWSGAGLSVATDTNSWHISGPFDNKSVHADNPSFWPLENGTVLLAYATKLKSHVGHKHVGLAVGKLPLSGGALAPFQDITKEPVFPYEAEDPTLWLDTTNNVTSMRWHIFAHRLVSNISREVCAHAVAANPFGPWKVATTPAYTTTIEWQNTDAAVAAGGNKSVYTTTQGRERPHIIFDRDGRPVALSTGVTPGRNPTPVTPNGYTGDFSYTHVQLLDPAFA